MQPIVYMHIVKSGGTSVSSALQAALAPGRLVTGFDHLLFGSFVGFDGFSADIRRTIFDDVTALPVQADLVAGHFARSTLRSAYPGGRFLTLLREPIIRLLSHWLYWRQTSDDSLKGWDGWKNRVALSHRPLVEFLNEPSVACQTDNLTTRTLLWPHQMIPVDDFIEPGFDDDLVYEALRRLDEFHFVDVVENEQVSQRLENWLGRPLALARLNETSTMPARLRSPLACEITREAHRLLDMRSRLDLRLWREIAGRPFGRALAEQMRDHALLHGATRLGRLMDRYDNKTKDEAFARQD